MSQPIRIQRRRTKGWKKPVGAIIVTRGTKWGNPFTRQKLSSNGAAKTAFSMWLEGELWQEYEPEKRRWMLDNLGQIRGHDLCCFCDLDEECHAEVLLLIANKVEL